MIKHSLWRILLLFFILLPSALMADIPAYLGKASIGIDASGSLEELANRGAFIEYGQRDNLGRATYAKGCLGKELVAGERASMANLEPTGWKTDSYDFIEGKYLYNRCHLVGHQFAGAEGLENIVTGTRYLNISGMLPYENRVAEYIQRTGNHVYYCATAVYTGENFLCDGVMLEAKSVEDNDLQFSVFCFNVQPGVVIDYRTGVNRLADVKAEITEEEYRAARIENKADDARIYILNTKSMRFHLPECSGAKDMKEVNRQEFYGKRSELIEKGYKPCGSCKP